MKLFLLALIAGTVLLSGCIQTGEGKVTDTVANVERQGLIWKTNELYLTNDHDAFFCLREQAVFERAQNYADSKQLATIHYRSFLFYWPWECGWGTEKYGDAGIVYKIEGK